MGNWVKGRNQCTRLKFHCFLQQESKTQETPRKTTVASLVAYSVAVLCEHVDGVLPMLPALSFLEGKAGSLKSRPCKSDKNSGKIEDIEAE